MKAANTTRLAEEGIMAMRIIAGQRRGHKIDGPSGHDTRPTSDLVRESLFNILAGLVEGRLALDLFAGTGALGLEALSRGAQRALFVERDWANVALIRRNLATLRYEDRGLVIPADVFRWATSFAPVAEEPVVVFIDPPYREYEQRPQRIRRLLVNLLKRLPAGSVLTLEASQRLDAELLPEPEAWDIRRYGSTQLALRTVAEPAARAAEPLDEPHDEGP
jgi:16S rRNA (guanine966-N2)-methyltransferase